MSFESCAAVRGVWHVSIAHIALDRQPTAMRCAYRLLFSCRAPQSEAQDGTGKEHGGKLRDIARPVRARSLSARPCARQACAMVVPPGGEIVVLLLQDLRYRKK
jgi:hypothetical protein